tara:strand:- start:961 stop:1074 length:114 start_codon:yes stop_codon:yes gene_type:complete
MQRKAAAGIDTIQNKQHESKAKLQRSFRLEGGGGVGG